MTKTDKNIQRFRSLVSSLQKRNDEYYIRKQGSQKDVIVYGQEHKFNFANNHIQGIHIVKALKDHLDKKFKIKHPDYDFNIPERFQNRDANLEVLKKNKGAVCIAIDIEDCYWDTMYNLGYISHLFWIDCLEKDEWKIGRNIAVGSLRKTLTTTHFKGKEFLGIEENKRELYPGGTGITNHVYNYVWSLIEEIKILYPESYCMFYVDCIWVVNMNGMDIVKYFRNKHYNSNCSFYEITNVIEDNGKTKVLLTDIAADCYLREYQKTGKLPKNGKLSNNPTKTYYF
jgi:hypothetical protein